MDETKESREALLALVAIGKFVSDRVRDGVDLDDAFALGKALTGDSKLKVLVDAGRKDADKIKGELSNMTLPKILSFAQVLPEVADIVSGKEVLA